MHFEQHLPISIFKYNTKSFFHSITGMGYGKLLNVANTRVGLRAILRIAMNFYDNAEEMVDELYNLYPEMDSLNTHERTLAASQMLTDFAFGSWAYYEAHHHTM